MDSYLLHSIRKFHNVYIAGAQSRARTLMGYLTFLYPQISIAGYLVDDLQTNDQEIEGISVLLRDKDADLNTEYPVFIATKGIYHEQITAELKQLGFKTIIPGTPQLDNYLKNEYVKSIYKEKNIPYRRLDELIFLVDGDKSQSALKTEKKAIVYCAKSIYDKPIKCQYLKPEYEHYIQVGAALTKERLLQCEFQDNAGDNISKRNRQYCELTALYWIWKNTTQEIVGLSHYRRHFILPANWEYMMSKGDIDVILPVPSYVSPNIADNYRQRHDPIDWKYLMEYIRKQSIEDYQLAIEVFKGNLYSPCNMFIMRRDILNDLCSWMFPIVDNVADKCGVKEDVYLNRYPGFLSERLITLYFRKYSERYSIVYADKIFVG